MSDLGSEFQLVKDVLHLAVRLLRDNLKQGDTIMSALSDLQAAQAQLIADTQAAAADGALAITEIKALLAQIAAGLDNGASATDLEALTTQAATAATALEASNAALVGAIPAPAPPSSPPPSSSP